MIQASIRITVPPEKLKEVLQTFKAILGPIRNERGCISCSCYLDAEVENNICFLEEWQGGSDLDAHLRSENFGVIAGAMDLFIAEPQVRFQTIASTAGMEAMTVARRR
jgi:quinol monooxygenase YgiN